MELKKIRKQGKIKVITIPKESDMKIGDYVYIESVNNLWKKFSKGEGTLKALEDFDKKKEELSNE